MKTTKKKTKITYSEPASYFPKEIRQKHKIGDFAESNTKKTPAKKTVKRK